MLLLAALYAVTTLSKLNLVFGGTLTAISNMHRKLSTSVTRAATSALDRTAMGSLLARFTTDLGNVEGLVMLDTHWVLEGCTDNLFVIAVVSMQNPASLVSVCVLVWMMSVKGRFANLMKYAIKCDDVTRGNLLNFIEAST